VKENGKMGDGRKNYNEAKEGIKYREPDGGVSSLPDRQAQ